MPEKRISENPGCDRGQKSRQHQAKVLNRFFFLQLKGSSLELSAMNKFKKTFTPIRSARFADESEALNQYEKITDVFKCN